MKYTKVTGDIKPKYLKSMGNEMDDPDVEGYYFSKYFKPHEESTKTESVSITEVLFIILVFGSLVYALYRI